MTYFAVVGRLHGDDEDSCELYEVNHAEAARELFREDMRTRVGIEDAEPDERLVYINHVLCSDTPIEKD